LSGDHLPTPSPLSFADCTFYPWYVSHSLPPQILFLRKEWIASALGVLSAPGLTLLYVSFPLDWLIEVRCSACCFVPSYLLSPPVALFFATLRGECRFHCRFFFLTTLCCPVFRRRAPIMPERRFSIPGEQAGSGGVDSLFWCVKSTMVALVFLCPLLTGGRFSWCSL